VIINLNEIPQIDSSGIYLSAIVEAFPFARAPGRPGPSPRCGEGRVLDALTQNLASSEAMPTYENEAAARSQLLIFFRNTSQKGKLQLAAIFEFCEDHFWLSSFSQSQRNPMIRSPASRAADGRKK